MKVDSISAPGGTEPTREKGPSLEVVDSTADANPEFVDMDAYRREVPLWKRIWQHSLTQMMLLSVQAFCGPAMDDAIAGRSSRKFVDYLHCILTFLQASAVVVWQRHRLPILRMSPPAIFHESECVLTIFFRLQYRDQLHHACHRLRVRWAIGKQARCQVVFGYWCRDVPYPWGIVLCQQ